MMLLGFDVDEPALIKQRAEIKAHLEVLKRIRSIILPNWQDFNPKSSQQCIKLLHGALGLKVVGRKQDSMNPELDEKNLYKLITRSDTPPATRGLLEWILAYRFRAKELETLQFEPYPGI